MEVFDERRKARNHVGPAGRRRYLNHGTRSNRDAHTSKLRRRRLGRRRRQRDARRRESRDRRRRGARPALQRGRRGRSRPRRARGLSGLAADRPAEAGARRDGASRGALGEPRADRAARHRGHGQDTRRRAGRGPARDRVDRGGLRHPASAQGREPRGRRGRGRRRDGPPAGGRRRRDHAVQLPGDDPAVVPAVRDRLRQHVHPEAVRARSPALGADLRADRRDRRDPARGPEPGPRGA